MIDASTADLRDPIDRNRRFSTASRYLGALERLLEEKNKSAVGLEVTGSIPVLTRNCCSQLLLLDKQQLELISS